MINLWKSLLVIVCLTSLGCAQSRLQIGNSVTVCCPGNYSAYDAYGIRALDMPLFLQPYMLEQFDTAFQEKGLERNDQINDIIVTLSYEHVNLNADQQEINPFIRMESIHVELSYVAVINISMRETSTGNQIWAGKISRIHRVSPGEYMHEERAKGAFLETFRDLLSHYPAKD